MSVAPRAVAAAAACRACTGAVRGRPCWVGDRDSAVHSESAAGHRMNMADRDQGWDAEAGWRDYKAGGPEAGHTERFEDVVRD